MVLELRARKSDTAFNRKKLDRKERDRVEKGIDLFSDDESDFGVASTSVDRSSSTHLKPRHGLLKKKVDIIENPLHRTLVEDPEEVEDDLDLFTKTIQINNIDKIDHAALIKRMHDRFEKKAVKWEYQAAWYARCSFGLNFSILLMQMIQMMFDQLTDLFGIKSHRANAMRCLMVALTGLVAGLQMKLKLTEKSEKYRRGAKVYGRLRRISTYYLMLFETGGIIQDVTGLWREAMAKEGSSIPTVKTYLPI
ncbi:uncharacterized protein LOC143459684 isoform X2 [Clavelina lepadiformis]|uniref:uncharacterized protein LOC143459684 isoform X2 n=1 Tax=Clavelina lepadiformis TaxID=159417 RepID=UPI0040415850